jgi:hypothetical protein
MSIIFDHYANIESTQADTFTEAVILGRAFVVYNDLDEGFV